MFVFIYPHRKEGKKYFFPKLKPFCFSHSFQDLRSKVCLSHGLPDLSCSITLLGSRSTASHSGELLSALPSVPGILQCYAILLHPLEKPFLIYKIQWILLDFSWISVAVLLIVFKIIYSFACLIFKFCIC